jgi:hypothetical protein
LGTCRDDVPDVSSEQEVGEASSSGPVRAREMGESSGQRVRALSRRSGERGRITKPSRRGGRAGGRSRGGSRAAGISRLDTSGANFGASLDMDIGVGGFASQEQEQEQGTHHRYITHQGEAIQALSDVPADVSQIHHDMDIELDPTAASIVGDIFGPEAYGSGR